MNELEPMIALVGDIFDLDALEWWSAKSKSPLYSVEKKDGIYWLKLPRFGLLTDQFCMRLQAEKPASIAQELIAIATEMTAKAKELIPIIKASAKVRRMDVY